MANINNIRLGRDYPDNIRFPSYAAPIGNQFTYFGNIIPKDNTNADKAPEGQWEINDDCEVEIISPRKIAIKKFKIDNWIIRRKTGPDVNEQTDEIDLFGETFKIKVTGLDYVHNNIICHTQGSNIPDGFTKAYARPAWDNWTVYWWPGQYTEGDNYARGLLIQGCINYIASQKEIDGSTHMGRAPGAMGSVEYINDGEYGVRGWYGIGCRGICIGLFGGVQNAAEYLDDSNGAYRVYDISDHPIYIDLDIQDTINYPIDLSTKECWDAYVGNTKLYHRDKTIENCWKKYGLATETYVDDEGNTKEYGYIKVTNVSGYSFKGGLILPEVIDWEDNIENICWNFKIANTDFWEKVRNWFDNNYTTFSMITKPLFAQSNIGGRIQIKLKEWENEEEGLPQYYLYAGRFLQGSTIESIHFISENECSFSSGNGMFIGSSLKQITFESPKGWLIGATDMSGILSQCGNLTSYPYNLINWGANRTNVKANGIMCTLMGWFCEYTPLIEIPSFDQENRESDDNTIIFATYAPQVFNGCNSLTKIGPICDLSIVIPNSNNTTNMFNCPNLTDVRIKNLNHGNWSFDGITRNEGYIGNLPLLNQESIEYLFNNLADLTTHDPDKHINLIYKSFANWSSDYWNSNGEDRPVSTAFRFMDTRLRFANGTNANPICYTNQTFEKMIIYVSGLQDGDRLEFGSGIISESTDSIVADGQYTIKKTSTNNEGFKLYSSNPSDKSWVSIQIVYGYDPTNPLVSSADLYCPANWEDKITEVMITSANNKGWNIYIDNILK